MRANGGEIAEQGCRQAENAANRYRDRPRNLMYFSYSQCMILDCRVEDPTCAWIDDHVAQGFARRDSVVCLSTLYEFGEAEIRVHLGPYEANEAHSRVIAVPFKVVSGAVAVKGPEEFAVDRHFEVTPGNYRLVMAQAALIVEDEEGGEELIELFFEPVDVAPSRSEILVCDEALNPPDVLIETADVVELG